MVQPKHILKCYRRVAVWALLFAQVNLLAAVCLHHHDAGRVAQPHVFQVHRATLDLSAAPTPERFCLTCLLIRHSSAKITAAGQAPEILAETRLRLSTASNSLDSVPLCPVLPRAPPSPEV